MSGTKYDHSNKKVAAGTLVFLGIVMAVMAADFVWHVQHDHSMPLPFFAALLLPVAPLIASLRPRWQLTPHALRDLRKRTEIPYASIQGVRVVKSSRSGAKVFAIQAAGKTHETKVLQGDAFAGELEAKLGGGGILTA